METVFEARSQQPSLVFFYLIAKCVYFGVLLKRFVFLLSSPSEHCFYNGKFLAFALDHLCLAQPIGGSGLTQKPMNASTSSDGKHSSLATWVWCRNNSSSL